MKLSCEPLRQSRDSIRPNKETLNFTMSARDSSTSQIESASIHDEGRTFLELTLEHSGGGPKMLIKPKI